MTNLSEQLAKRVRAALGDYNNDELPVTQCAINLRKEVDSLQAECEKLRKDAERYRWLRDGNKEENSEAIIIAMHHYGDEWDEMIDIAISSKNTLTEREMEILNLTGATLFNKSRIIDPIIEIDDVALDDEEEFEILDKIERFLPKVGVMSTVLMEQCARQIRDLVKELDQTHALVDVSPDFLVVLKRTADIQGITILSKDDLTVV